MRSIKSFPLKQVSSLKKLLDFQIYFINVCKVIEENSMLNFFNSLFKEAKRIRNAFSYSFDGLKAIFSSEAAFRDEVYLCILLFPCIFLVDCTSIERLLLFFSIFFVLFAEIVNTMTEVTIDRISSEKHPLSKKAKDMGSLIVLLSFLNLLLTWGTVLLS